MSLKVVTVFGGSGFLGRHLIRRLAKTGAVIRVPVRNAEKAKFLKPMGDVGQIVPIAADIRDPAAVAHHVEGADAVVFLVGILAPTQGRSFQAIHADAPGMIARAAASAGVGRLVQVSAMGADANAAAEYLRTKAAGEAAVRAAMADAVILRPSIVFGPEDGFFNLFASLARFAPVLPAFGGGGTRMQPVYVGDVADAIMAGLTNPATNGQTYELGGPEVFTFQELIKLALIHSGRPNKPILPVPFPLAMAEAWILEKLPLKLLTRDQVTMLKSDNVCSGTLPGLAELGISPTALAGILPTYLDRFRPGGRFAGIRTA
ncbi:MAG: complex I NDUFA9 subunit family protein [Alphaproteobacteria bacterium]|nr:complex I NDUFA9 subunit family protein [Alphaproteobacteria bacterium]TAD87799.1 MAG: complex I NDUFA9 subunit family protein [Alphaproteobacteria bacterium]